MVAASNYPLIAASLSPAARKALGRIADNGRDCVGRKVLEGEGLVRYVAAHRVYNLTFKGAGVLVAIEAAAK